MTLRQNNFIRSGPGFVQAKGLLLVRQK